MSAPNKFAYGTEPPDWSVIVITRDEEAVISACLESVITAFSGLSYELILVDSASGDRTVEIAKRFNPHIVRLSEHAPLRPSVGRHAGLKCSRGKWILFLDGDSLLTIPWIQAAVSVLETEPQIAGVAGEMEHTLIDQHNQQKIYRHVYDKNDYKSACHLDGSAVYRRDALEKAGGFNPFLCSSEEAELGARLRKAGYQLRRLKIVMTRHFPKHAVETTHELFRRLKRGYFTGLGQFVRHSYHYNLPTKDNFRTIQRHIQFFILVLIGIAAAILSITYQKPGIVASWGIFMLALFIVFAMNARSLRKAAYYFLEWAVTSPSVIWGFLKVPHSPDEFPDILNGYSKTSRHDASNNSSIP